MGNKNVRSIIKTPAMRRGIQNINAERFGILVFNTVSLIYLILISLELIAGCRHPPWNSVIETKIDFDQIHNQECSSNSFLHSTNKTCGSARDLTTQANWLTK